MNDSTDAELADALFESSTGRKIPRVSLSVVEQGLRKLLQDSGAKFHIRQLPALAHGPGFEVQGKIEVGKNWQEFRYCIAYCPIQETSYVAERENGLHVLDFHAMDEFNKVTIPFDQGIRALLPYEPYIFEIKASTHKTK